VTGVLEEVSLKTELILYPKSSVLHFSTYNGNSPVQSVSANVIQQNDKYYHKIVPYQFTYILVNAYKIILFYDVHRCHFCQCFSKILHYQKPRKLCTMKFSISASDKDQYLKHWAQTIQ